MKKRRKEQLKYAVLIPLIVAIALGAGAAAILARTDFPSLTSGEVVLGAYERSDIKQAPEFTAAGEKLKTSDMPLLESDTLIGTIGYSDAQYPLIYSASDINAVGKMNITNGRLPGSVGCSLIEIFKDSSSKLRLLAKGDTITVETFYSGYEFEVTDTFTAGSLDELEKLSAGAQRGVILYTDSSIGTGIGSEYYACLAVMTSGSEIEG